MDSREIRGQDDAFSEADTEERTSLDRDDKHKFQVPILTEIAKQTSERFHPLQSISLNFFNPGIPHKIMNEPNFHREKRVRVLVEGKAESPRGSHLSSSLVDRFSRVM